MSSSVDENVSGIWAKLRENRASERSLKNDEAERLSDLGGGISMPTVSTTNVSEGVKSIWDNLKKTRISESQVNASLEMAAPEDIPNPIFQPASIRKQTDAISNNSYYVINIYDSSSSARSKNFSTLGDAKSAYELIAEFIPSAYVEVVGPSGVILAKFGDNQAKGSAQVATTSESIRSRRPRRQGRPTRCPECSSIISYPSVTKCPNCGYIWGRIPDAGLETQVGLDLNQDNIIGEPSGQSASESKGSSPLDRLRSLIEE
jgi:hypothetical protein